METCKQKGITPQTDKFVFDLKINNKVIYSETISRETIDKILKEDSENSIENTENSNSLEFIGVHLNQGKSCSTLKKASYTGYGKFDFVITINNVIIENDECNLYHSLDGSNHILSKDSSLNTKTSYSTLDNHGYELETPIFDIWTYGHGGQG